MLEIPLTNHVNLDRVEKPSQQSSHDVFVRAVAESLRARDDFVIFAKNG